MIACAGISLGEKVSPMSYTAAEQIIQINLFGVLYAFDAASTIMVKQKSGHLVALASVAGLNGLPGAGAYSSSKAAVLKLCESLSIDYKRFGITVTAIAPGFIDTPLTRKNKHPMPFIMDVETAAKKIKKAIEQKKALYMFPLSMKILVVALSLLPRSIYRWLMSKSYYSKK